jgi:phage shock protein A
MNVLKRISKLISANVNHLLDEAEDAEVMVKQLIRDMEESIIELRRETVRAVAREKQLTKQIQVNSDTTAELEKKASFALDKDDEEMARQLLAKKLQSENTKETLEKELEGARELALQLKADLSRLEDQVQMARRKKEELIRRKRAADAQKKTQETARKSIDALNNASSSISAMGASSGSLETYETAVSELEAEAEAARELLDESIKKELDLQKEMEEKSLEDELERLKKKRKGSS